MVFLKSKIGFGAVVIWSVILIGLLVLPSEIKDPASDMPEVEKNNTLDNVSPAEDILKEENKYIEKIDIIKEGDKKTDEKIILIEVPFTSQAPLGKWSDPRQKYGCEEASVLMAMTWVNGIAELSPQGSEKEIIAISDYEMVKYGTHLDTSAEDTVRWIFNDYFKNNNVKVKYGVDVKDIKNELLKGNIALVPVNGQKLKNPFYTPPGPIEHMIVVIGHDGVTGEFITNDPGTKRGKNLRYKEDVLNNALMDYPTSIGGAEQKTGAAMIVVSR